MSKKIYIGDAEIAGGDGKSAYQSWLDQGNVGTEAQFLASLKGADGKDGKDGAQGNTGSSVDYPYELVNNVTTNDATKGLSAAQGVVLDEKISQLGLKVDEKADQADLSQLEAKVDVLGLDIFGNPMAVDIPDDVTILQGHISSGGVLDTESSVKHILVPVTSLRGNKVSVAFDDLWVSGQWAFIASVNGTQYTFVDGGSRQSGVPTNQIIPSDANYLYCTVTGGNGIVHDGTVSFSAAGGSLVDRIAGKVDEDEIIVQVTKNLINPDNIAYDRRYSNGTSSVIAADANKIASSGLIPVVEGEWYVVSGLGIHNILGTNQNGGYFGENATGAIGDTAIANITWADPVDANGKCFQVPTGQGIKYVIISLATNDAHTALAGNAQMEEGEMATAYEDYNPVPKIKESLLPDSSTPVSTADELTKYTTFGNLTYPGIGAKIPTFRKHFYAKDKDLMVVNTGTSLTARSSEHCTLLADAPFRPPLMHSNNFASHIWDRLCWQGQQYRRYDSSYFTETGTGWQTQSNIADWDDGAYRAGLTRYTDNGGSIAFAVPAGAWQFNFIYRADSAGSTACVIAVAEGNNKMEVWNGSAWVEANGYSFSERESAVATIPSVTYTNPDSGASVTLSDYQVKGNTTYQKRLKMRCKSSLIDSLSSAKSVTITSASGRLLYWGVEWSPREFMITYINAARGSFGPTIDGAMCLLHYQDNEVWGFQPDLLLSEDPIHNGGGAGVPNASHIQAYFANTSEQFWFANNGISMKARCAALGLTEPEWALFNTSITWNFGGITDDGLLKVGPIANGLMWSALESQSSVYMAMLEDHPDIIYINAVKNWVDACMACYESMRVATTGSGKNGATFTNEGSHWNDTGCKVMARVVLPILDFIL